MKKIKITTVLLSIIMLFSLNNTAHAQSLKCLSKPALSATLAISKTTLEGLQKSLPEQLKAAQKIKEKLPPAIAERTLAYNNYKANPSPENKNVYNKKNLAYQSINTAYQLQYDLYLGQKKKIPTLLVEIKTLQSKIAKLEKECSGRNKP